MEVLAEALLVDGDSGCHFDEGLLVRRLCWAASVKMREGKTQADQTDCSPDSHRQHCESRKAGTVKSEDIRAAGQMEHMTRSSGYANTAVGSCIHVEGARAQEESMGGAIWRMDKDMWAGHVPADKSRRIAVSRTSFHLGEAEEAEEGQLAGSIIVGSSMEAHTRKTAAVCWSPNKPRERKVDTLGGQCMASADLNMPGGCTAATGHECVDIQSTESALQGWSASS